MRHITPIHIVMFVLCVSTMIGCVVYVAHRTTQWLGLPTVASYAIFFFLFITIVAAMGSSWYVNGTRSIQHWVVLYGCYAAGVFLTLIFTMFAVDLATLPFKGVPIFWKGVVTYGLTVVISLICFVKAMHVSVDEVEIPVKGLKSKMRVVQLTDLHLGHFRGKEWLHDIVSDVNALKPDIVVITGDIYESHYNLTDEVVDELLGIKVPVYYVAGNHDKYVNLLRIKDMLRRVGVRVLDNEVDERMGLQIAGTGLEEVKDVIDTMMIDGEKPCVMLRHYPNGAEVAVEHGVDLMLAGHTHGGQMFPVTLINHFGFKYNRGLYEVGNGYIYVSNGAGTTGPPMRFGTKSVISLVTLKPEA